MNGMDLFVKVVLHHCLQIDTAAKSFVVKVLLAVQFNNQEHAPVLLSAHDDVVRHATTLCR